MIRRIETFFLLCLLCPILFGQQKTEPIQFRRGYDLPKQKKQTTPVKRGYQFQVPEESWIIEEKDLSVQTPIRVHTYAQKTTKINVPVWWQPISFIVQDGQIVKKDQLVTTFESRDVKYDLSVYLLEQAVLHTRLDSRLQDIDNKDIDNKEKMGELEDKLAVAKSKLARQQSEPTQDDVRIVQGKLKIAILNRESAEKDYIKAKDRFQRKMISRVQLDEYEKTWRSTLEKEKFAKIELEDTIHPPTKPGDLRSTQLEIEKAQLEIERLEYETQEQRQIGAIQKGITQLQKERKARQIAEKQSDLEHLTVRAPQDGCVSLNLYSGAEIVLGTRMWLNYTYLEIPDMQTIHFKGVLPETQRSLHQVGDPVLICVNGRKESPLRGTLSSISTLSHDLSEKEESAAGRSESFGTKVFDIEIQLPETVRWLRPNMYGSARLGTKKAQRGPAVPLRFIKQQDGKRYLFVGTKKIEITGTVIGSWFLLDDRGLLGKKVNLYSHRMQEEEALASETGSIAKDKTNETDTKKKKTSDKKTEAGKQKQGEKDLRLTASGEIAPIHSVDIRVGEVGWWPWPKITWLQAEESMVKKGDIVAKLDPKTREQQMIERQTTVSERKSTYEELLKNVEITRRQGVFNIAMAKRNLEITTIASEKTLNYVSATTLAQNELTLKLAEIDLKAQQDKVNRELARKTPTMSPQELERQKRQLRKCELKVEQAKLNLEIAKEGSSAAEKCTARMNLQDAQDNLALAEKTAEYSDIRIRRECARRKQSLWHAERWLKVSQRQVENHNVRAPADGLLCYNKVVNGVGISKVAVGNTAGQRCNIMSIPDLTRMEVKVDVDEKYFSQIKIGMPVEVKLPSMGDLILPGKVSKIDLLFNNRGKKDRQIGIYSSHEPLGEVVFHVHIQLQKGKQVLKPGIIGEVRFPIAK